MPQHILVFTKNNAYMVPYSSLQRLPELADYVVDPDLSKVSGVVPSCYWKATEDGKIIPMTNGEKARRSKAIKKEGLYDPHREHAMARFHAHEPKRKRQRNVQLAMRAIIALSALVIYALTKAHL